MPTCSTRSSANSGSKPASSAGPSGDRSCKVKRVPERKVRTTPRPAKVSARARSASVASSAWRRAWAGSAKPPWPATSYQSSAAASSWPLAGFTSACAATARLPLSCQPSSVMLSGTRRRWRASRCTVSRDSVAAARWKRMPPPADSASSARLRLSANSCTTWRAGTLSSSSTVQPSPASASKRARKS
ncbi:hypothetical protein LMG3328_05894 [Achromobacter ruhlandii]|uniref:Uncharacterized protein n=1 Tax=Achromobacter ruhlandii TaxID=72557 RepID=A0A6S7ETG3_9BURK|nr:hypothetical protein LMG3328_05894 [Achromobacter ruhlandii]